MHGIRELKLGVWAYLLKTTSFLDTNKITKYNVDKIFEKASSFHEKYGTPGKF